VFSLLRRLSTLYDAAGCDAAPLLLHARNNQSISPAHRALGSKPAARRYYCRSMGQTDGRTDGWTDRQTDIDPAPHTMWAASLMFDAKPMTG